MGHSGEIGAGTGVVAGEVDRHLYEVPGGDLQRPLPVPPHYEQTFSSADQDLGFRHSDLPLLETPTPAEYRRRAHPYPSTNRPISKDRRRTPIDVLTEIIRCR